uniref:Putative secreted protein n=1 Tax=Ixodes ricinus TaxID=34613 RepID=A0A6B0UIC3_IXORI
MSSSSLAAPMVAPSLCRAAQSSRLGKMCCSMSPQSGQSRSGAPREDKLSVRWSSASRSRRRGTRTGERPVAEVGSEARCRRRTGSLPLSKTVEIWKSALS